MGKGKQKDSILEHTGQLLAASLVFVRYMLNNDSIPKTISNGHDNFDSVSVHPTIKPQDHVIDSRSTSQANHSRKLRHGSLVTYWKKQGGGLSSEDLTTTL